MSQSETFAVLIFMVLLNSAGTLSITFAAKGHGLSQLWMGMALYAFGAVLFWEILRSGGDVGLWGPVSSMAGLILITVSGNLLFAEAITHLRVLGLVCAAFAILLIALGAEVRS